MEPKKAKKDPKKKWVIHCYDENARYDAALIANLFRMPMTDVVARAITCYANALRITDKMEERFPKGGKEVPVLTERQRRPIRLSQFEAHKTFFRGRTADAPIVSDEETTEEPS